MYSQRIEGEVSSLRGLLAAFVFIAVATVIGYCVIDVISKGFVREWLMLLSVIQLTPFLIFLVNGRANYLSFVLLEYFATYSVSKWKWLSSAGDMANQSAPGLRSIQHLTFCTILMVFVYFLATFLLNSMFKRENKKVDFKSLKIRPWPFITLVVLASFGPLYLNWLPGSLQSLFHTATYFAAILILTASCPDRPILEPIAKVLLVWGGFLVFLYDASLGNLGFIIIYLFILGCIHGRRYYFIFIAPLFALLFVFQSIKGEYRYFVWYSNETPTRMDHLTILRKLLVYELSSASEERNEGNVPGAFESGDDLEIQQEKVVDHMLSGYTRMSDDSLERVMDMTPNPVPYWGGETYYNTLLIFIPRIIWPDKPTRAFWNKFGRAYGYLLDWDYMTSISVGYLAEGYMNFGIGGLYGVAIFMALLIASVEALGYLVLNGHYAFTFTLLLLPLSNYSNDVGTMINDVALIVAVLFLTRYRLIPLTENDAYS